MSKAVVRGICLLVVLLSLGVRFVTDRNRQSAMTEFDAEAAIVQVLRSHGLQLRENPVKPPKLLAAIVYFQRPECERVSLVLPYLINLAAEPFLARVTEPGADRHFYYLDGSWREQRRPAMYLEWVKYAMLDLIGASPYVPVKKAIVLVDPPDCRPADIIDWRVLWEKNRLRSPVDAGGAVASEAARS